MTDRIKSSIGEQLEIGNPLAGREADKQASKQESRQAVPVLYL